MTKIIVTGACGKMGRLVLRLAASGLDGIGLGAAVERKGHPELGRDAGEIAGCGRLGIAVADNLREALRLGDVIVDFTTPEACLANIEEAARGSKAIVIGTTGFSDTQRKRLEELCRKIPTVLSPNMSPGMNLLFRQVPEFARRLQGYDVEIVEVHHRHKKDAPSGTALRLGREVARALGRDLDSVGVYGRKGITGPRDPEAIGIHSLRAGEVIGEHTVIFAGPGERVEITHRAESREAFARGAILAAKFVVKASPGLHDMSEVLENTA